MLKLILLLASLDANGFGVRQRAENLLMHANPPRALLQAFYDNGTAESRFRLGRLMANLYPNAERIAEPTEIDPMPPAEPQ